MAEAVSPIGNKVKSVGSFLFTLNKYGLFYDYEPSRHEIKIKGRVRLVEYSPMFNLCVRQNKAKKIQVFDNGKMKIIMLADATQYIFDVLELPKDWRIRFEKGYLVINY